MAINQSSTSAPHYGMGLLKTVLQSIVQCFIYELRFHTPQIQIPNQQLQNRFCLSSTIKATTKKRATKGPHILSPRCTNHTLKTLQPTDSSKTKMSFSNLLLTKKPLINFMQNYFQHLCSLKLDIQLIIMPQLHDKHLVKACYHAHVILLHGISSITFFSCMISIF